MVGAFLRQSADGKRPELDDVRAWVRQAMGSHKAPSYLFWIGDPGVGEDYPKTGSGKHQKHILRAISEKLLDSQQPKAKL